MIQGQAAPVRCDELTTIPPGKKDRVRLITEDQAMGTVIGLDGPDAVIRIDNSSDFRIVPIVSLVKLA